MTSTSTVYSNLLHLNLSWKASCFGSAQDSTWRKVAKCCKAFAKICPHFHLEMRNAIFITRDLKYARPTPAHFGVKSSLAVHVERHRAVSSVKKACEQSPSQQLFQQFWSWMNSFALIYGPWFDKSIPCCKQHSSHVGHRICQRINGTSCHWHMNFTSSQDFTMSSAHAVFSAMKSAHSEEISVGPE